MIETVFSWLFILAATGLSIYAIILLRKLDKAMNERQTAWQCIHAEEWLKLEERVIALESASIPDIDAVSLTQFTAEINRIDLAMLHLENLPGVPGPQGEQGPTGQQGAHGPPGPQGPIGPIGQTGIQGPQGQRGEDGQRGPQGERGPEGIQGQQGPAGIQGPAGATGEAGPQGPQGTQGPQGLKGDIGAQGPQGIQGPAGATGEAGPQGPQGVGFKELFVKYYEEDPYFKFQYELTDGTYGDTMTDIYLIPGPAGLDGEQGPQGPQGLQGPTGPTGGVGSEGPIGPQGLTGLTGAEGPQGPQGLQGDRGLTGNTGPEGPQGEQGPAGQNGANGKPGKDGKDGKPGKDGVDGAVGPQGPQGEDGASIIGAWFGHPFSDHTAPHENLILETDKFYENGHRITLDAGKMPCCDHNDDHTHTEYVPWHQFDAHTHPNDHTHDDISDDAPQGEPIITDPVIIEPSEDDSIIEDGSFPETFWIDNSEFTSWARSAGALGYIDLPFESIHIGSGPLTVGNYTNHASYTTWNPVLKGWMIKHPLYKNMPDDRFTNIPSHLDFYDYTNGGAALRKYFENENVPSFFHPDATSNNLERTKVLVAVRCISENNLYANRKGQWAVMKQLDGFNSSTDYIYNVNVPEGQSSRRVADLLKIDPDVTENLKQLDWSGGLEEKVHIRLVFFKHQVVPANGRINIDAEQAQKNAEYLAENTQTIDIGDNLGPMPGGPILSGGFTKKDD